MNAFSLLVLLMIKNVLTESPLDDKAAITSHKFLVPCKTFKANVTCPLGFAGDPLTKECIPKCAEKCVKERCVFQFCYGDLHDIDNKDLTESCDHILTFARCWQADLKTKCQDPRHRCVSGFVVHPYDHSECILSCTDKSCTNGICSRDGNCICNLGYRLDPRNGRECVRVPQICHENLNTTCVKEDAKEKGDQQFESTTESYTDSNIHLEDVTNGDRLLPTKKIYSDECICDNGPFETRIAVLTCTTAIFVVTTIVLIIILIIMNRWMLS